MKEKAFLFWLYQIKGIGKAKRAILLKHFKTAECIFRVDSASYQGIKGITEKDIKGLIQAKEGISEEKIEESYNQLKERQIQFIVRGEKAYPEKLSRIYDPPDALFVRGKLPDFNKKSVAIVGARNCSAYGKEMAEWFGRELGNAGIQIVSGLARGIDGYAHSGALEGDGDTFAVLGCGVDVCYPPEHISLFTKMINRGGIISEYAMGTAPKAGNFPMRNRILSGLADGIIVVEAKKRSGSLITAEIGLEQGKDIFAIPGKAWDSLSEGSNSLIKEGAFLVTKPNDVIDFYEVKWEKFSQINKKNEIFLDFKQKMVYSCLSFKPKHISIIIEETQMPFWEVTEAIIELQLQNRIREITSNCFVIERD
ncbi:DNA-processing protein DprA [Velocimicrobium porci]|uniref:DNA-protecting protein DprA n=1 Tax=Velocimicrobium porci TaxID=2606634 RepID=A0A6L5XYJ4_9FIRM|nr:DNA-processing protein DprA [Velocimicrobium porci]MSS63023.1 DNA-protecting protein DprA [Velocimicrobium porci]